MSRVSSGVVRSIVPDLRRVFGDRLQSVVAYGRHVEGLAQSLALVSTITVEDLDACARCMGTWRRAGAATPLFLTPTDFARSLDAFPIEYGDILSAHDVVEGPDPFHGLAIRPRDLRRACEVQTKSHLLHLREDYIESAGHHTEVAALVRESAPGFQALIRHMAALDGRPSEAVADLAAYATTRVGLDAHVVGDLLALADAHGATTVDATKVFPAYLHVMERLADFVDRWPDA
jgi:hypothetical protein